MKRIFTISIITVLLVSLVLIPYPVRAAFTKVWVDDYWQTGVPPYAEDIDLDSDFATIQAAINNVDWNGTVHVKEGTYKENLDLKDKKSLKILGAGAAVTTINGDGSTSVVTGNSMNSDSRIEGFTITSNVQTTFPDFGGGINLENSATTIASCNITGNKAKYGGGIYLSSKLAESLSPQIINSLVINNFADTLGGGIFFLEFGPSGTSLSPEVMNSTIADNEAGDGGGIYNHSSTPTVKNAIVYGNTNTSIPSDPNNISNYPDSVTTVDYSCIEDGYPTGTGNIDEDPSFVGSGDYHLQPGSDAIDAGDPSFTGPPLTDLDGNSRIVNSVVDMGAYEYGSSDGDPPEASNPSPPDSTYTADSTPTISVDLTDDASGVDAASIVLTVEGATATHSRDGSTVSYTPTVPFADGQVVDVTVDADDNAGNTMAPFSWSFTVTLDYTLTINIVGNGDVLADPLPGPYPSGTEVELTADPDPGWSFTEWSDGLTGTENPKTITMDGNKSVTANFIDKTPPEISISVSPDTLWPPNHKMVEIIATVAVSDTGDPFPTVVLSSIVSNEPDDANGNGDGNTMNDIQGVDIGTEDYVFLLRAERDGSGNGRVYTITYTSTDASGNNAIAIITVTVPHDLGKKAKK